MKTKNLKVKEPVRLRMKTIKNGNASLYLDIYNQGVRKYEFLRLYIIPEHSKEDRQRNRKTLQLAHSIRLQRLMEIQESRCLNQQIARKHQSNFLEYIDQFAQTHKKAYKNLCMGLKQHLIRFRGNTIPFCDINKTFLVNFHLHLQKAKRPLSQGSLWNYFNVLSRLLNKARQEEYLSKNPMHELTPDERPRRGEPKKTYLVIEEVRKLAATPIKHPEVKRAFLFACLCGLRFSDIKRLQWENLQTDSHGNIVAEIIQQKTHSLLYLPISKEAAKQLPPTPPKEGLVFKHLPDASHTSKIMKQWIKAAGITKGVTFHTSRHTFATLSLTYGAELYTISKLLGHNSIRITQIYADIINEKKRKAVDAIPTIS